MIILLLKKNAFFENYKKGVKKQCNHLVINVLEEKQVQMISPKMGLRQLCYIHRCKKEIIIEIYHLIIESKNTY